MSEIINVIIAYMGRGFVPIVYVAALVVLVRFEKDRAVRMIFGVLPAVVLVAFLLPPFHWVYSKVDGADTYYRILWMLPMVMTIAAVGVRMMRRHLLLGVAFLCAIAMGSGSYVYAASNTNMVQAENRLHIPNAVITVCDTIMNDTAGEDTKAAMPSELVQFVRQYNAGIELAYGREMLMPQYSKYYANAVYEAMERNETIDAQALATACMQNGCWYIVMNASRTVEGDLTDYQYEELSRVDGYIVYKFKG